MQFSKPLWAVVLLTIIIAFIVGRTEPDRLPRVGYILVERYGGKEHICFEIDQLRFDNESNRYYVLSDDGTKWFTTTPH